MKGLTVAQIVAFLSQRRKAVQALLGSVLTWFLAAYVPDQHVSAVEWGALAAVFATALGVHQVANDPAPTKNEPGA